MLSRVTPIPSMNASPSRHKFDRHVQGRCWEASHHEVLLNLQDALSNAEEQPKVPASLTTVIFLTVLRASVERHITTLISAVKQSVVGSPFFPNSPFYAAEFLHKCKPARSTPAPTHRQPLQIACPFAPFNPNSTRNASPTLLIASSILSAGAAANVVRTNNASSLPFSARNQLPLPTTRSAPHPPETPSPQSPGTSLDSSAQCIRGGLVTSTLSNGTFPPWAVSRMQFRGVNGVRRR